jgi:hypothetical protein
LEGLVGTLIHGRLQVGDQVGALDQVSNSDQPLASQDVNAIQYFVRIVNAASGRGQLALGQVWRTSKQRGWKGKTCWKYSRLVCLRKL